MTTRIARLCQIKILLLDEEEVLLDSKGMLINFLFNNFSTLKEEKLGSQYKYKPEKIKIIEKPSIKEE